MISGKGKRLLEYNMEKYYWFVRSDRTGTMKIHILSEDKRIILEYPVFDKEVPVTPAYIRKLLEDHLQHKY